MRLKLANPREAFPAALVNSGEASELSLWRCGTTPAELTPARKCYPNDAGSPDPADRCADHRLERETVLTVCSTSKSGDSRGSGGVLLRRRCEPQPTTEGLNRGKFAERLLQ